MPDDIKSTKITEPPASCFVGGTMIDTTIGRCSIADLARLSTQRDATEASYAQHLASLSDAHSAQLAAFDVAVAEVLAALLPEQVEAMQSVLDNERAVLAQALADALAERTQHCATQVANVLPRVLVRDPETGEVVERAIVKAWSPRTATALVDVVIDSVFVLVGNQEVEHLIRVRCTPEHLFLTPNGDVEASALEGVTIYRVNEQLVSGEYEVTQVEVVEVETPVAVFDIEVEGIHNFCVSPSASCCAAVVHNSAYKGLQIETRFVERPYAEYGPRTITDPSTGESFDFEAPSSWSDQAVTILATKYRRKTGVPIDARPWLRLLTAGPHERKTIAATASETSAAQIFGRLAGAWAYWGLQLGYFDHANAGRFRSELTAMLEQQVAAPNSPQWFNTGLHWAYGITGKAQGHYAAKVLGGCADHEMIRACTDAYSRPQVHACFIQGVEDTLVGENGIMDLMHREARLFKFGSGTGTNYSCLRGKGEPLTGGGTSSGVMSFLTVSDRSAGAIKSAGTTRRAARMVILDVDHPDIEAFVGWKGREEDKVHALRAAGIGDASSFEDEATNTVSGQNGNNSVRLTDEFMCAVENDHDFDLTYRTTGEVAKTVEARDLWQQICEAAWKSGDPGVQFHDTINAWHTCIADGEIEATNPCSEYCFLHDTACNLASLNLAKFLLPGGFDDASYQHAVRMWTIVLDISVSMAGYPSKQIAERSMDYRTLGLGYANLGGALMRQGIPYDSDKGRKFGARVTSLLGAYSWQTSAELAELLGPFPAFERNKDALLAVLRKHTACALQGEPWTTVVAAVAIHGARNAQCTLLAPTGTIGLVMDCDSFGGEPVYALSMTKTLAGGGSMKMICPAADAYLTEFYGSDSAPINGSEDPVLACANDIPWEGHLGMMAVQQPFLCGAISKTVNMSTDSTAEDIGDVYMYAWKHSLKAVAVYRNGSKATQVLTSTTEDEPTWDNTSLKAALTIDSLVTRLEYTADVVSDHERACVPGLKSASSDVEFTYGARRGVREAPPAVRSGTSVRLKISGESYYVTINRFEDGRPCEVFVNTGKAGGAVSGWANAFAMMLSFYLQIGGNIELVIDKLRYQRFEPAGFVSDAPLGIRQATSPVDAIAQLLAALGETAPVAQPAVVEPRTSKPAPVKANAICSVCRSTNMQPVGSCLTCLDCGSTTGCG